MKRAWLILILFCVWLASSWSLFHESFFRVHDYVHAARVVEMARGLQEGQLPVRWSENFGYGYGMPLFEFYAPLPFFVGALFYLAGLPIIMVLKIVFGLSSLLTLIGAFYLGKTLFGERGGLLVAAAFTLAPYRAVNLFVRGSLSEAWGIMAMPWILLGGLYIIEKKKNGWLILVLGLVTLMLSHNITTLMFVPLSVVFLGSYLVWHIWQNPKSTKSGSDFFSKVLLLASAYLMAGGLAAFYMIPAVLEKDYTQIDAIFSGYFHYSHHFLYIRQLVTPFWGYGGSGWGPDDGMSFFLGAGQLLGLSISLVLVAKTFFRHAKNLNQEFKKNLFVWLVASALMGVCLALTLLKSKVLWDAVSVLSFIQFPWRWLGSAALFLSLAIGSIAVLDIQEKKKQWVIGGVLFAIVVSTAWYFRPESYLGNADDYYYTDADRIQRQMSSILPDYIPLAMGPITQPPMAPYLVPAGVENQIETILDRGHEKMYKTSFTSPLIVSFAVADFPGWVIELDGQPIAKANSQITGSLAAEIPAGSHMVGLAFQSTPIRQFSDIVTGLSVIIFMSGLWWQSQKKAS